MEFRGAAADPKGQLRHSSPVDEKFSTGKTVLQHTRTRLVKRRRALRERNPPRNSQPETHPDDERGRWPRSRRLHRMERFPDASENS
jgi:hypothetical protein